MSFQRQKEEESPSLLKWVVGGVIGLAAGAAVAYTLEKEKKTQEATHACRNNKLKIKVLYNSEEQAKVLLDTVATKIDVSLVFSPVCILEAEKYAHVALKFDFQQNGQTVTVVIAGICSDSHHILEPEVTFSVPRNTFRIMSCGEIFMAPYALMKMCECNPSNNTVYDIYQNNCYVWALNFGKMVGYECGQKIVSTIEQLRDSQNRFIVYLGDVGHVLDISNASSSFSSFSSR